MGPQEKIYPGRTRNLLSAFPITAFYTQNALEIKEFKQRTRLRKKLIE